jgi:hypothetical protein
MAPAAAPLQDILTEGLHQGDIRLDAQGNYAFANDRIAQSIALALLQSPDQLTEFLCQYGDRLAAMIQGTPATEAIGPEIIAPTIINPEMGSLSPLPFPQSDCETAVSADCEK